MASYGLAIDLSNIPRGGHRDDRDRRDARDSPQRTSLARSSDAIEVLILSDIDAVCQNWMRQRSNLQDSQPLLLVQRIGRMGNLSKAIKMHPIAN